MLLASVAKADWVSSGTVSSGGNRVQTVLVTSQVSAVGARLPVTALTGGGGRTYGHPTG